MTSSPKKAPPTTTSSKNAVTKALDLLFLVGELSNQGPARITTLLEHSAFTRPTIHRHLNTLHTARLVERTNSGGYILGSGVLALASNLRGNLRIRERALPTLRALATETGYTVHLGVRDGDRVIYVEKIENKHPIRLASTVGQAAGMHSSGLGKAILASSDPAFVQRYIEAGLERRTAQTIVTEDELLAELNHIRASGYAVDDGENEAGVRCVAAPILDHDACVVASLSVSGTAHQIPNEATEALSVTVKQYAHRISTLMGFVSDSEA